MDELGDLLRQISLAVGRHAQTVGRELGRPARDIHAIGVLAAHPEGISPSRLAAELGLSAPATTALVDRMLASGHAERAPWAGDRRRSLVRATPLALAHSRERFAGLNAAVAQVLARHDPQDVATVTRVMTELRDAVEQAADSPD